MTRFASRHSFSDSLRATLVELVDLVPENRVPGAPFIDSNIVDE